MACHISWHDLRLWSCSVTAAIRAGLECQLIQLSHRDRVCARSMSRQNQPGSVRAVKSSCSSSFYCTVQHQVTDDPAFGVNSCKGLGVDWYVSIPGTRQRLLHGGRVTEQLLGVHVAAVGGSRIQYRMRRMVQLQRRLGALRSPWRDWDIMQLLLIVMLCTAAIRAANMRSGICLLALTTRTCARAAVERHMSDLSHVDAMIETPKCSRTLQNKLPAVGWRESRGKGGWLPGLTISLSRVLELKDGDVAAATPFARTQSWPCSSWAASIRTLDSDRTNLCFIMPKNWDPGTH